MSKIITSSVKGFTGTVTLCDPMNMAQSLGWGRALRAAQAFQSPADIVDVTELNAVYLPAVLACAEAWNINGMPSNPTIDTFPFSPRLESALLISWLIGEITKVYTGEELDEETKNA